MHTLKKVSIPDIHMQGIHKYADSCCNIVVKIPTPTKSHCKMEKRCVLRAQVLLSLVKTLETNLSYSSALHFVGISSQYGNRCLPGVRGYIFVHAQLS